MSPTGVTSVVDNDGITSYFITISAVALDMTNSPSGLHARIIGAWSDLSAINDRTLPHNAARCHTMQRIPTPEYFALCITKFTNYTFPLR